MKLIDLKKESQLSKYDKNLVEEYTILITLASLNLSYYKIRRRIALQISTVF
jgi:hypothetical protein